MRHTEFLRQRYRAILAYSGLICLIAGLLILSPLALLLAYRQDHDWATYEARFIPLLTGRAVIDIGRDLLTRYHTPCLLCAESTPECCHRRLVAEHWAQHISNLSIIHL